MTLKQALTSVPGLRYLMDALPLSGARAMKYLHALAFTGRADVLNAEYDWIERCLNVLRADSAGVQYMHLQHIFYRIRDIGASLHGIDGPMGLDEIQLFEIKQFAISCNELIALLDSLNLLDPQLRSLDEVVDILDPEHSKTAAFGLYDAYSPELANAREKYRHSNQDDKAEALAEVEVQERKVLAFLREVLQPYASVLRTDLKIVSFMEIRLAKAFLALKYGMHRPVFESHLKFQGLFNPQLRDSMESSGKHFQEVDVDFLAGPQLITGANMSGKSVLLQSICLAQTLAQFGFFVPASSSCISLYDSISLSAGDHQNTLMGLSSFAAEMLKWDACMQEIRKGQKILVLLDEPARTTNPVEGRAIVLAMTSFLKETETDAVIATHYGNLGDPCPRWRVKGFDALGLGSGDLRGKDINALIDHTLIKDTDTLPPPEALRIASLLGVDAGFLQKAETYLK